MLNSKYNITSSLKTLKNNFMPVTSKVIEYIINIGPVFLIPIILLIISLTITRKPLKNLKNCAFILVGMMSVSILLTLFVNFFKPITNTIILNSTKEYTTIDAGWLVSKVTILNSPVTLHIIIGVFILNIIMLLLHFTRTINIDLWNYWSFLLAGSLIFSITGLKWVSILVALITAVITLILSDIYAVHINSYFGIDGISTPLAPVICWAPISHLINTIFDKIPFIKKVHLFYEEIQYKVGIFSEPTITGFILGFIIGAITRYRNFFLNPGANLLYSLTRGLVLSAIFTMFPRAVNLLFKGLSPTIKDIKDFIKNRITKREIYIGLDPVILAGMPSTLILSVFIIPLTVYISTILPGNTVLPSADLIMIPIILTWVITISNGDIIRSAIPAIIIIPIILWITGNMGDVFTDFFIKYDLELMEGFKKISSIGGSSNIFFWILLKVVEPVFNLFT
jgi:PTS system galactitol-specific IIC component